MQVFDKSVLTFDKNNEPLGKAVPGEVIMFKPMDCFSNQVNDEATTIDQINIEECNPAAGPVIIEGAEPGDVIAVEILKIDVGGVDFLKDTAVLRVTYEGNGSNDVDGQYAVRKSQWREV